MADSLLFFSVQYHEYSLFLLVPSGFALLHCRNNFFVPDLTFENWSRAANSNFKRALTLQEVLKVVSTDATVKRRLKSLRSVPRAMPRAKLNSEKVSKKRTAFYLFCIYISGISLNSLNRDLNLKVEFFPSLMVLFPRSLTLFC